jgi:hypothetical protein
MTPRFSRCVFPAISLNPIHRGGKRPFLSNEKPMWGDLCPGTAKEQGTTIGKRFSVPSCLHCAIGASLCPRACDAMRAYRRPSRAHHTQGQARVAAPSRVRPALECRPLRPPTTRLNGSSSQSQVHSPTIAPRGSAHPSGSAGTPPVRGASSAAAGCSVSSGPPGSCAAYSWSCST